MRRRLHYDYIKLRIQKNQQRNSHVRDDLQEWIKIRKDVPNNKERRTSNTTNNRRTRRRTRSTKLHEISTNYQTKPTIEETIKMMINAELMKRVYSYTKIGFEILIKDEGLYGRRDGKVTLLYSADRLITILPTEEETLTA